MQCETCGAGLKPGATRCVKCGAAVAVVAPSTPAPPPAPVVAAASSAGSVPLQPGQRYCAGCGSPILMSSATCSRCGARQHVSSGPTKSRVTAGILALLLGGLGVHKFYCGRIWLGFLYLIFFWTWIPAIIGFIEGIIYLASGLDDHEFTRKYCS